MDWRYTLYVIFLFIAAAVLVWFTLRAWRRHGTAGATALAVLMAAGAVGAVAYALSLTADEPSMTNFWGRFQYFGIVVVPVAWFIFALQYTGREGWVTRRGLALLAVEPAVALVLIFTNESQGLFWSYRESSTTASFPIVESVYGPFFWVHLSYSYLLLLIGTIFLTQALVSSAHLYREQRIALVVGILMPWMINAVNVSGLMPVGSPNPSPIAFSVAGMVFARPLFRYGPLDLVTVARDIVVEGMGDGVIVLDSQDRVLDLNPAAQRILDCSFSAAVGHPVARIMPSQVALLKQHQGSEEAHGEAAFGDGAAPRYYDIVISSLRTQKVERAGRLISLRDITERKVLEQRLMQQALHDPLTGLPNRNLFMNRLEHALAPGRRRESRVAVLFMDLDNFKFVNDSLGHEAGDQLLVAVSKRVQPCLRAEDTIARLGGDEFAMLIEDVKYTSEPAYLAERIVEELQAPFAVGLQPVVITPSIGIAIGDSKQDSPEHLLREADIAMYRAKEDGKARHRVFDPIMELETTERLKLETDLRRALQRDEFRVHYQPVVHLGTGRIVGMEALLRWEHPERGVILPDEFVPLAEEIGLIIPIGRWVLCEAFRQAHDWRKLYHAEQPLSIGVNLSTRQLQDSNLVEDVEELLLDVGMEPEDLVLEITESAVVEAEEHRMEILRRMQALGVRFALDDFGTGYSSLSYLKRMPVSLLKIDRSFVERIGHDAEDEVLVSGIVYVASALGLSVVAEGVETPQQLAWVKSLGCELGQGNYFSKPLSSEAAGELLATYMRKR